MITPLSTRTPLSCPICPLSTALESIHASWWQQSTLDPSWFFPLPCMDSITPQRSLVHFSGESFRDKILAVGVHTRLFYVSSDRRYILDPRPPLKLKPLMLSYGFCSSHWPSDNFYLYCIHFSYTLILQCSLYFSQALKFSHFFTYSLSKFELCLNH